MILDFLKVWAPFLILIGAYVFLMRGLRGWQS